MKLPEGKIGYSIWMTKTEPTKEEIEEHGETFSGIIGITIRKFIETEDNKVYLLKDKLTKEEDDQVELIFKKSNYKIKDNLSIEEQENFGGEVWNSCQRGNFEHVSESFLYEKENDDTEIWFMLDKTYGEGTESKTNREFLWCPKDKIIQYLEEVI